MYRASALAAFLIAFAGASTALASSVIDANVTYVGIYGDGRFYVGLDTTIDESGCPNARFDVPPTHPQIKNWLAIVMTALATGRPVRVKTSGCWGPWPTMSQGPDSFVYLMTQ